MNALTPSPLRWEQVSAAHRAYGVAEQWFADAGAGRFTVKRRAHNKTWSAEFVGRESDGRETRYGRGRIPSRQQAMRWCATAHEQGKDHAMSLSEDAI